MESQRRHVFHASAMTFNDARMECVANNGDLPSIENNDDLENVITNVTANANSTRLDVVLTIGLGYRSFYSTTGACGYHTTKNIVV